MSSRDLPVSDLVAALLLDVGAVQVNAEKPFRLTSGKLSPIYFDCRRVISCSAAMTLVTGAFQWYVEHCQERIDIVAGGESAGIPFADRLAAVLGKPMVYVRKQPRQHGTGSAIEGSASPGCRALLVEDLITDGASKLVFVNGLREAGLIVEHCVVLLDRQQGGSELLANAGVELYPLVTARQTLDFAAKAKSISSTAYEAAIRFIENPTDWKPPDAPC